MRSSECSPPYIPFGPMNFASNDGCLLDRILLEKNDLKLDLSPHIYSIFSYNSFFFSLVDGLLITSRC